MKPGLYESMPAATYHAGAGTPRPSLSSSLAKILLSQTPRHAWLACPQINPYFVETNKTAFDIGRAAHALLLEGEESAVVIDAPDYRTAAARAARDAAYAEGRTPLLAKQAGEVIAMVASARAQIAAHPEIPDLAAGRAEQTAVWREYDIWCRCRFDWLANDRAVIIDYKTTTDANPDTWGRRAFDLGYDVQAAWYCGGARALFGIPDPRFLFLVQETAPPYALAVCEFTPAVLAMAAAKVHHAAELWRDCLARDRWPGYPATTAYIEAPPWIAARWEEAKAREEIARQNGGKLVDMMIDWQAPLAEEDAA